VATLLWGIERDRLRREIERLQGLHLRTALRDPLTKLPNLQLFRERLQRLLTQGRRSGKRLAVLFLDLDRFKEVNDDFGHEVGDRLLCELARRFTASVRETDTAARRCGDEFVILLEGIAGPQDAGHVARDILRVASAPLSIQGTVLRPSVSIGIAVYPEDGLSARMLERRADEAMYSAKRLGGDRFCFASGRKLRAVPLAPVRRPGGSTRAPTPSPRVIPQASSSSLRR